VSHPWWLNPSSWPLVRAWERSVSAAMQQTATDERFLALAWQSMRGAMELKSAFDRWSRAWMGPWADCGTRRNEKDEEGGGGRR
jgi:hypothetical protein